MEQINSPKNMNERFDKEFEDSHKYSSKFLISQYSLSVAWRPNIEDFHHLASPIALFYMLYYLSSAHNKYSYDITLI